MKKLLIIISLASCMFAGEMGLSAYGGLNMANVACDDCEDDMKPGVALGVQYHKLPVVLGLGISTRGSSMEEGDFKVSTNFTYLDISALYPYELGPGKVWAGLDLGMNLSATVNSEVSGVMCELMEAADMSCTTDTDIEDVGMDYGLALGYTYSVNDNMGVYVSYYMGLAEITKDSEATHTGIGLGITYGLPF